MADMFSLETLDVERLIKVNKLKPVTNPIFFSRPGVASEDGLLSREIFGVTKEERAGIFSYVDLGGWFIDPLSFKKWAQMDCKFANCARGVRKYSIIDGQFVEDDENGSCGIEYIMKIFPKIEFKRSDSIKRDDTIEAIKKNYKEGTLFINKYIVIPAFYRDVLSTEGKVAVGEINDMYAKLLITARSFKEAAAYGLEFSAATAGRIQQTLVDIYNWFTMEPNLGKKMGLVKRAVMSKTADYSSRLVLSAPDLRVETMDDLMSTINYTSLPLASASANFFPFVQYWIRRWFENAFSSGAELVYKDKDGNKKRSRAKNPDEQFSDRMIKKQINRFIRAWGNRFVPITVELESGDTVPLYFKGSNVSDPNSTPPEDLSPLYNRRLTWCDLIYQAAEEVTKDKHVLITRFPLNDYFGQFPTKVNICSTTKTCPMYLNLYGENKVYKHYPYITDDMIGKNTRDLFSDTLKVSNAHLGIIGGDYDGDQVSVKGVFTEEANKEIDEMMNSLKYCIDLGASNVFGSGNEAIQCLYNLTMVVNGTEKLSKPKFDMSKRKKNKIA